MTAMDGAPAPDVLRQLVREVLKDVLPTLTARNGSPPGPASAPAAPPMPGGASVPPTSDPPPSRLGDMSAAAAASATTGAAAARETASGSGVVLQPVRLATDEDLHEFVLQIVRLADNPKRRRDLLAGRFRFTLASAGIGPAPVGASGNGRSSLVPAGHGGGDHRIERGAVTERAVQAAASAGVRLVLGPRAVLTPLARDRARALGVPIEKER
jgi:hypothetical protein